MKKIILRTFFLTIAVSFLVSCSEKPKWISGKWHPNVSESETTTHLLVSAMRVGYEIRDNTFLGYTTKDFESDPVRLFQKVINAKSDDDSRLFFKRTEATFKIQLYTDSICKIELLSGNELKFGNTGWGFISDVVPGTIITFKKSGEKLIIERDLGVQTNDSIQFKSTLRQQQELYLLIGNTMGGKYRMSLIKNNFEVANSEDLSKN